MKYLLLISTIVILTSCKRITAEVQARTANEKGINELNNGNFEDAIVHFKKAIKNPNITTETKAIIYRNIAQAYNGIFENDSAIRY